MNVFLIISIVLFILILILFWAIRNLIRKNEAAEDILISYMNYLNNISQIIEITDEKLKNLDSRGIFKSDDEIGFFFDSVKSLQDILNEFNVKNL